MHKMVAMMNGDALKISLISVRQDLLKGKAEEGGLQSCCTYPHLTAFTFNKVHRLKTELK